MNIIEPIARGASLGGGLILSKSLEDSVRVGRNTLLTGISQIAQVHLTLVQADLALEGAGLAFPLTGAANFVVRAGLHLAPALLAIGIKRGIENATARNIAVFIHNHIGTLSQIVSAISCIALIALGQLALAITSLTLIGIGFLDRVGLLPEPIRHILHSYGQPFCTFAGFFVGGAFEKLVAVVSLASFCYEQYAACQSSEEQLPPSTKGSLTCARLEEILNGDVSFQVNRRHLREPIEVPTVTDVQFSELLDLFDAVNWSEQLPALRTKLSNDAHYRELVGNPDDYSDEQLISYLREKLKLLVDSNEARHITNGEIQDYDRLKSYLNVITHQLKIMSNPVQKSDYLMRLAIDGGQYCGPGQFHAAEEIFSELIYGTEGVSSETKVLFSLQEDRTNWMNGYYTTSMAAVQPPGSQVWYNPFSYVDVIDLHVYDQFINTFGQEFGLRKGAADNDSAAVSDSLQRLALNHVISSFRQEFDQYYDAATVAEMTQDAIGTSRLPRSDIYSWWSEWIAKQPTDQLDEAQKEILMTQLFNNELLGHPMQEGTLEHPGAFNEKFVAAMLVDMGVLQ